MTKFNFNQLQEEQIDWVERNFGNRPSWQPLLGICEEAAELIESCNGSIKSSDYDDAIADMIIFASDYCNAMSWNLQKLYELRHDAPIDTNERTRKILFCIGKMQHHYLKSSQKIRGLNVYHDKEGQRYLSMLLYQLDWVKLSDDLYELVERTWNVVKQRDWVKERENLNVG